jgi:iron complex outermembrane receptor protein
VSGEVTYFRNAIDSFIFRNEIGAEAFEAREEEFVERFGGREPAGHDESEEEGGAEEQLAFVEFVGADVVLQGVEAHADVQLTSQVSAEFGVDYVRGTLTATDDPLPRMPPLRGRLGLRYQRNAFQAGGDVTIAAKQDRVLGQETPTDGYGLLRLFASYSFGQRAVHTLTARLDNATDTLYRNHLSLIKDLVPEMGANVKLLYNLKF